MKKLVLALVAVALLATPALAEMKLNGYYRLQGTGQSLGAVENTSTFIDQRLRLRLSNTLNDYVSFVYYAEIDTPWGEKGKAALFGDPAAPGESGGGKLGADGVNVETKNVYLELKVPDTDFSVRTGIFGWGPRGFESLVLDDDMAGIALMGDLGSTKMNLIYSKWNEGVRSEWDDQDFYGLQTFTKISDQVAIDGFLGYQDDNTSGTEFNNIYVGVGAETMFSDIGIEAFFLYKSLKDDSNNAVKVEGSAWAADLKGKFKLPMGGLKAHFAYFPADDDATKQNTFDAAKGGFEYHSDNMMIFLTDVYYNSGSQGALALKDAAYTGYGLMFFTVSGDIKMSSDYYAKYGVGYFTALDDRINGGAVATKGGKDLGFEIDAMVGKKIAKNYDLSLRGAYGLMGDFYKVGTVSPDNTYKVVAQLNVGF